MKNVYESYSIFFFQYIYKSSTRNGSVFFLPMNENDLKTQIIKKFYFKKLHQKIFKVFSFPEIMNKNIWKIKEFFYKIRVDTVRKRKLYTHSNILH